MGRFLSTTYKDTVEGIAQFYENLVNNPFYILNDKKPVFVTYYNINKELSSVDPGSKLQYDNIGGETPMRFNRIFNFALYGLDKIELNTEMGEFGLEANPIEGDAYILPNTIVPYENDYFEITHVKDSSWLFIIKDVQKDTLDNGSNAYKITYKLEYTDHSKILQNIVDDYEMIEKHEGTNVLTVVRCKHADMARLIDEYAVKLKKYYCDLFYQPQVQTFIYCNLFDLRAYDPYMIEFLSRNHILDNGESDYIYVAHQLPIPPTFAIDYDQIFLRAFEKRDKNIRNYLYKVALTEISSFGSIFDSRYEPYWSATYKDLPAEISHCFHQCFDEHLMDHVMDHTLFDEVEEKNIWRNILVKYFYMDPLTEEEVRDIDNIHFNNSIALFYTMPVLIYCLERYIEKLLS